MDIRINADGSFEVEIPDSKGRPVAYRLTVEANPVGCLWACWVVRLDNGKGYRVQERSGLPWPWACGCPDWKNGGSLKRGARVNRCKHIEAAETFRTFLRRLVGVGT